MKAPLVILVSVVLAAAASVGVVRATLPASQPSPAPIERDSALAARLDALEQQVRELTTQLTVAAPASMRAPVPEVSAAAIDAAVARHLAAAADGQLVDAAVGVESADFDPKVTLADLRSGDRDWNAIQAVWGKLTQEQQDAVLAEFEAIAAANPYDAGTQNELGEAYVHRLMNADMLGMMKFGQLAEKQFDKALELDDHHWSARFNKAMSLSNQPAFLGRRPEAIEHYRTLIAQQEAAPPESKHAQTYLFLGNLYAQAGEQTEAEQVWQSGLARFPEAKALLDRLGR